MEWPCHKTQGCGKGEEPRKDTENPSDSSNSSTSFERTHAVTVAQPGDKVAEHTMKDRCKGLQHFLDLTPDCLPTREVRKLTEK